MLPHALKVKAAAARLPARFTTKVGAESRSHESSIGIDTTLIDDGTYLVVEIESEIVACGGWSKRKTLFGGDRWTHREDDMLDPALDAAKIRAFFVDPDWARR